jgi:hypothetical protein
MDLLSTKLKKKAMLNAMKKTLGNVLLATKQVGISRSTHYNWLNNDENYELDVYEIKETAIDFCEAMLLELIANKNTQATIFYLKCQAKARGYEETKVDIKSNPYKSMSDQKLKSIIGI